jgi:hypothetical protein
LKWTATGWNTRWTGAAQVLHDDTGSSVILCMTSKVCPFSQRYS